MKQNMTMHDVRKKPIAVTENPVAVTEFSVTAIVPPGRSLVPEPAPSALPGGEARQNSLARRQRHESPRSRHQRRNRKRVEDMGRTNTVDNFPGKVNKC